MRQGLLTEILGLTIDEKMELINRVQMSIEGTDGVRSVELLDIYVDVTGRKPKLFSRDREDVWAKAMVAYRMFNEGYTVSEISRQMFKNHSTVIHYRQKMEDALSVPQAYQDIIPIWNEFQKRIEL